MSQHALKASFIVILSNVSTWIGPNVVTRFKLNPNVEEIKLYLKKGKIT